MSTRKLGSMGESKVEHWAHERSITANRVQNDSGGWDLLLQIPHSRGSKTIGEPLLDIRPPEITCMVQVKATDKSRGKIKNIKLSNWERLAKAPLPSFFVVLEYGGKDDVQRAYLVHIDKFWIGKTLKRLRKLRKGEEDKLHKKTMVLTYSETNRLATLAGKALEGAIRIHVGEDPQAYFERKVNWIKTVGFEKYPIKGSFALPPMPYDQTMNIMVDFSIGLTTELRLSTLHMEEVRFGIPRSLDPEIRPENTRLKIDHIPPAGKAEVNITDENSVMIFRDFFDFFSPSTVFPFIPFDYWKTRFASELLSFIISHRNKKITYNITPFRTHKAFPLPKLAKVVRLIRHLSGPDKAQYRIQFRRGNNHFEATLHFADFPSLDPIFNDALQTVEDAWLIAKQYDCFDDLEVYINDLLQQQTTVRVIKAFLDNRSDIGISSIVDISHKKEIDLSSLALLVCCHLVLGQIALVMTGSIQGKGEVTKEKSGYRLSIHDGTGKFVKKWVLPTRELRGFSISKALEESSKLLSDRGVKSIILQGGTYTEREKPMSMST